jgi:hypothetical protein
MQTCPDHLERWINTESVLSCHPENVLDDRLVNVKPRLHETIDCRTNLFELSDALRNDEDTERSDDWNVETLAQRRAAPLSMTAVHPS